jgi:hypothetical protein
MMPIIKRPKMKADRKIDIAIAALSWDRLAKYIPLFKFEINRLRNKSFPKSKIREEGFLKRRKN